jgi:hypothetical protein
VLSVVDGNLLVHCGLSALAQAEQTRPEVEIIGVALTHLTKQDSADVDKRFSDLRHLLTQELP